MTEENEQQLPLNNTITAEVRTKRGLPIVWLIPIVALIVGGWLAYKTITEQGPLIRISFANAEGLEAGKTKVMYKDVVVGKVEEIKLSEQLDGVVVMARMEKDAEPFLTENTRFWVVRARIAAGEITGLGTLLSGAYIGTDPVMEGAPTRSFTGLAKQPLVTANVPGQHYLLSTPTLGSLDIGSPIFYRQIKVGEVVDYDFDQSRDGVEVKIFIHAPHHDRIKTETKFWNASGVDLKLDASGIKIDTQSLVSILQGGIAFNTPASLSSQTDVMEGFHFQLHPNQDAAAEKSYRVKNYYVMHFDQSVRGLVPGAPVEFRGIPIGEVVDIKLIYDTDTQKARIPVLVMIEPERMELQSGGQKIDFPNNELQQSNKLEQNEMFKDGLRAQLQIGNLLTGQLYIDTDIHPETAPFEVAFENGYPIFPTISTPLGQITEDVSQVLKKIDAIPFEELGDSLQATILTLKSTLEQFERVAGSVDQQLVPNMTQTMDSLQKTVVSVEQTMTELKSSFGTESALSFKAQQALDELTVTIRSVKSVADQLDRNPRSLIFGRGESNP